MNQGLSEKDFAEMIAAQGGRAYRVGRCVHEQLRGVVPGDVDLCLTGMVKKNFKALFPEAEESGRGFPVYTLRMDGQPREIAFARTERKEGRGYRGFKVASNPKITIEQDLLRRDTTVNAMAMDCLTGELIDPFQGRQDNEKRLLRATGSHFADDPMRAIRLAGDAARLDFAVEVETLALARATKEELRDEPAARVFVELGKVLKEAVVPSRFFAVLAQTELLAIVFPELAALPAEEFARAMAGMDAVAVEKGCGKLRFALLGLVLEQAELETWNERMIVPADWLHAALVCCKVLGILARLEPAMAIEAIYLLRRSTLTTESFDRITRGCGLALPALQPLQAAMAAVATAAVPTGLRGKEIGNWIKERELEAILPLWQQKRP